MVKPIIRKLKSLFYQTNRLMGNRNVYVDCGCNQGEVLESAVRELPGFEFHAFEPHPELFSKLKGRFASMPNVHLHEQAVWIEDTTINFYESTMNESGVRKLDGSTLMQGKLPGSRHAAPVDYENPLAVQAIDFSRWLLNSFKKSDLIIVKMDIEGAEYDVLRKMLEDQSVQLLKKLFVEFHFESKGKQRLEFVTKDQHDQLIAQLRNNVDLQEWR